MFNIKNNFYKVSIGKIIKKLTITEKDLDKVNTYQVRMIKKERYAINKEVTRFYATFYLVKNTQFSLKNIYFYEKYGNL